MEMMWMIAGEPLDGRTPRRKRPRIALSSEKRNKTGGEGGIRTLGTGYPVRQISKAASMRD